MDLFCQKDDFLALDTFYNLSATATARYKIAEKEDTYAKQFPGSPVRTREPQFSPGHTSLPIEVAVRYSKSTIEAVAKVREFLMNECSVKNPEIVNIWFAYSINETSYGWHCDGAVRNFPLEHCITTGLYIHTKWEPEWGGEFKTKDGRSFMPLPNRLAVWSRDIIHKVEPIHNPDPAYLRMIMATTWTSEGKC